MPPASSTSVFPLYVPARAAAAQADAIVTFGPGSQQTVPLAQLGPEPLTEAWRELGDLRFGVVAAGDDEPLEPATRALYERMIQEVRAAGYSSFVRIWNHIGSINEEDNGVERYKLFCAGRHEAFAGAGFFRGGDYPAASGVGMPGRGLVSYYLAAREAGVPIENPRQIAAYDYPPQYGPRSPSFSRATRWKETLFVSGTSSVVGHASVHLDDVERQMEETLRNMEIVIAEGLPGATLANVVAAKTYLRHAGDYPRVAAVLDTLFPSNLYLQADICRAELLIEIEAVAVLGR